MPGTSFRPVVAAILPAAGVGARMGGQRKQFRLLGDRPVLLQTAGVLAHCALVSQIVIAVSPDAAPEVHELITTMPFRDRVRIVLGGSSRAASVRNALRAVAEDADVVLVHDAVRPFVREEQVEQVCLAAHEHGAASLAIPVADTLRREEDGFFSDTVERRDIVSVQTPQAFRRDLLVQAHEAARPDLSLTDDAAAVMALGHSVQIVPGSILNMKITTEDDWRVASMVWQTWELSRGGDA